MRRLVVLALVLSALPLTAQNRPAIGVGLSVGSMGVAVDGAVQLMPRLGVRGRVAFMPYEPEFEVEDIQYAMSLPSPQMGLFADLFLVGALRFTGGLRYSSDDLSATGQFTGTVEIGDQTYTASEIGALTGTITTEALSPYLGIGFGRVAGTGLGFFLDAGVAFHGEPVASLSVDGPIANQPAFQAELDQEIAAANADIDGFKYYPVIALGLRIGF